MFFLVFPIVFLIKRVVHFLKKTNTDVNAENSFQIKKEEPPLSLFGQVLWREFFYTAATNNPHFDRMHGNPVCLQIPWDRNAEALAKWAAGRTGFPWIDAIMTQLREEGWIHHLARHAVACFLTRGDLWLSWEEGMKVEKDVFCFKVFGRAKREKGWAKMLSSTFVKS